MALSGGFSPRTDVPVGQEECVYGKWFGRAWRDVSPLLVGSFGGVAVLMYAGTLSTGVLDVSEFPVWAKLLLLGATLTVGVGFGALVCFLVGFLPNAWKRHWVLRIETMKEAGQSRVGHSLLSLHSKHYHRVINLRCVVRDPSGRRWEKAWQYPHHVLAPAEPVLVTYPQDFDEVGPRVEDAKVRREDLAPWPEPLDSSKLFRLSLTGRYRVCWDTDVLEGTKRKVLARRSWQIR